MYDRDLIYRRMGKYVMFRNTMVEYDDYYESIRKAFVNLFNTNKSDMESLETALDDFDAKQSTYLTWKDTLIKTDCDSFFSNFVKTQLNSGLDETVVQVIDDLIREMNSASDKVKANTISSSGPTSSLTNSNAGSLINYLTTQMAREDNYIEVICSDVGTQGSELWEVRCSAIASPSVQPVTDEDYEWEEGGISFKIIEGTTILEYGDTNNQLSSWSLTGYDNDNSDEGKLYYTLTVVANGVGYTHVLTIKLYSDSDGDELVASGTAYYDGAPVTCTITQENASGISGSVVIDGTTAYAIAATRYVLVPLFVLDDAFYLTTDSDDGGLFLSFVRDLYDKLLPNSPYGYEITVDESFAE